MTYCPDLAPGAHRGSAQLRSEKRLEDFRIQPSSNRGAALRKVASLMKKSAAEGDFCISGLMGRPSRMAAQPRGRFWPADPIAQCLDGGHGWFQVKRCRCETDASSPLEHVSKTARDSDLET